MGAYRNPAMIEDKSGQILAQGFKELAAGIAAGVQSAAKIQNDALEARRKKQAQDQANNANAEIKAGDAALKFKNDIDDFKIENPTLITEDGLKVYDEKSKIIGDNFYNSAKIYYNPNSSSADRKKAFEELQEYGNQVKGLQNQISNIQLGGNIAAEYVNDSDTIYLPITDSEGNITTTVEESRDIMRAWGNGLSAGYISNDKKYTIKYDDNNNMQITFTDMEGNIIKEHTINSNSANAADQFAVKGYNGTEDIQEYSKEQGIVDDKQMFTGQYKGQTTIEIKDGVQTTKTVYDGAALNKKYGQLYSQIYTDLMTADAKNPEVAAQRTRAFLQSRGLEEKEINEIFKNGVTQDEIKEVIKQYVRDTVVPGYKIDDNGDFYTTKEQKASKSGSGQGGKKNSAELATESILKGWGDFNIFSYNKFQLSKSPDGQYYTLYRDTGTSGGQNLQTEVGRLGAAGQNVIEKYKITDGDDREVIYQALTAMGLNPAQPSSLPIFN